MNSLQNNNPGGSSPQKIRLKRVPSKREIIQKNLVQVKQNIIKKKKAQMAYYNSNSIQNQSPLRRQGLQKNTVQNRLGLKNTVIYTNKNQQRKQQLMLTTGKVNNNNNNQNRRRFQRGSNRQGGNRNIVGNNFSNNRGQKFVKRQSIQDRLNQIRQQQQQPKIIKNSQQLVVSNGQNKIKLRRPQPQLANYKIQVNALDQPHQQRTLNPQLQAEIKAIQNRIQADEVLCQPVASSKIGVTGITLNDRFSKLM